jgi:hypothetical protein
MFADVVDDVTDVFFKFDRIVMLCLYVVLCEQFLCFLGVCIPVCFFEVGEAFLGCFDGCWREVYCDVIGR